MKPQSTITAIGTVKPNDTRRFTHTFQQPAVLKGGTVSTHLGHQYGLRYYLYLERESDQRINLIDSMGENYLAGNGSDFELGLRREVQKGDKLIIKVQNTTSYEYHANARIPVDYEGMMERAMSMWTEVFQ